MTNLFQAKVKSKKLKGFNASVYAFGFSLFSLVTARSN